LAKVREAGEKEVGLGYWIDTVVGVRNGSSEIVPLVHRLYSQDSADFVSENQELLGSMRRVHCAAEGRGIFVLDRGGDCRSLYKELLKEGSRFRFIIRQRGDRQVLYGGKLRETLQLAQMFKTPYAETLIKEKDGKEKAYFLRFGFLPVRLVEHRERQLWLVAVKGLGQTSLMLLATEPMQRNRKVLWWVVQAYLTRWRVEETIRFIKQSYNLEDIRVRTYQRLKNMAALVLAASFFAAVHIGHKPKLQILALNALNAAQRIFGIPNFCYYGLADGIREVLSKGAQRIMPTKTEQGGLSLQLSLLWS